MPLFPGCGLISSGHSTEVGRWAGENPLREKSRSWSLKRSGRTKGID